MSLCWLAVHKHQLSRHINGINHPPRCRCNSVPQKENKTRVSTLHTTINQHFRSQKQNHQQQNLQQQERKFDKTMAMPRNQRNQRVDAYWSANRLHSLPRENLFGAQPLAVSALLIHRRTKRVDDSTLPAHRNQQDYQRAIAALQDFDLNEPMLNIMQLPGVQPHMWGWGRSLAQSYLVDIFTNWPSDDIMDIGSPLVEHNGARMQYSVAKTMETTALIVILSIGAGPNKIAKGRICSMNTIFQHKPHIKSCFVQPLITDMMSLMSEYHDHNTMRHYMNVNLSNRLVHLTRDKQNRGIWSKRCLQMKWEGNHPQNMLIEPSEHMHDAKGIEFTFLRILEQFDKKIRDTNPRGHAALVTERCLLPDERAQLRTDYSRPRDMRMLYL
jgi:hypothetical protein